MKAKITHYRYITDDDLVSNFLVRKNKWYPLAKGGATKAIIEDDEGNKISSGMAFCSPRDNYNKKIGRMIATGRAMKKLREVPASFEYRELTDSEAAAEEATWD